ncbi:MAG: sugar transferase [Saprospiraceae bacterium]|nr:sugar transferase [Saprospiraceae bacterium]
MNLNFYQSAPSLDTREMIFVGFENTFDTNIQGFPYQAREYQFEIINEEGRAFQWLEQRVNSLENYQLPFAVFCNLTWLKNNGFEFAERIRSHPDLRFVPFIVFAGQGEKINRKMLLQQGVDDCFTIPVHWRQLKARLDFLNQYKSKLLELSDQVQRENYCYQIPQAKRIFDIAGSLLGILISCFIWLPVAVAIALESKGPVLYHSKRVGADYRIFNFLKFRSMYVDADQHVAELQHLNVYSLAGGEAIFLKFNHDPRITRVGRFIRKYSIDELPQLINVLRGEMSLVGNRPLPVYEAEMLTRDEWSTRFLAPAGITGLWQVSKRDYPDMSSAQRIELDIAYARDYSLRTDLDIILRTFRAVVQKEDI